MSKRAIIIGGGISGLATAYFLKERGVNSTILEQSRRLGGLIQTDTLAGCRLEAGPDSFIATKPAVLKLANKIEGLSDQIIGSNDAARQVFIVRDGELVAMPRGMSMMVPGIWKTALASPLFSARTKARFIGELFTCPKTRAGDISVGAFVRDHFGSEVLECIADPLLTGVYGGNTADLSAQSVLPRFLEYEQRYGSLIRAVRREQQSGPKGSLFLSFQNGMQTLTDAVAAQLGSFVDVVHEKAVSVEKNGSGWRVRLRDGSAETAAYVVFACPAFAAAEMVESFAPSLASELASIPYSSAILATFVYERSELQHPLNGFGFLVPQQERRQIAAATWISTKFPSRIPPHLAAVRAFIVAEEATKLMEEPDSGLIETISDDLHRLMNIDARPLQCSLYRWPRSMPQYVVGHEQRHVRIEKDMRQHPGLFLTGNAYDGVGIPDCIRRAEMTANSLISLMESH